MTGAVRLGAWRLWIAAGAAGDAAAWRDAVATVVEEERPIHRSRHAATYRWRRPGGDVFVKVYRRAAGTTALKDLVRPSKARRAERMSARLAAAGLGAPRVLAVGEERRGGVVRCAWLATAALDGAPAAAAVARMDAAADRRATLAGVGTAVAELHRAGFVAGDLVAPNVWLTPARPGGRVTFLDHDRTVRCRGAAPWWRARRNLVQLNRLELPGVTATDRLRVYRAYAGARGWRWPAARRRLGWIVAKTAARRRRIAGRAARRREGGA